MLDEYPYIGGALGLSWGHAAQRTLTKRHGHKGAARVTKGLKTKSPKEQLETTIEGMAVTTS